MRLTIADDETILATMLRLQPEDEEAEVVGVASDERVAVDPCPEHRPDVAPIGIRMPVVDGVEAVRRITAGRPTRGDPGRDRRTGHYRCC